MSGRFVRDSKLRNVFGTASRKDQSFEGIRVTKHNNVAMCCAANPKFMAVVTQAAGGGSFMVLPLNKTGRVDINQAQVTGHKCPVIDIAWSPFDDNLIASCDDNGAIMVWQIPDEGLVANLDDPVLELNEHQKRVAFLKWHPLAQNILLSCGMDCKAIVWNLDEGVPVCEITTADAPQDACWNYDGSAIAIATKDKTVRIYNPLTGEVEKEFKPHESSKEQRVQLLKNNKVFTTGFTRMSQRQYKLFDLDKLDKALVDEQLDQTNAPLNIFYDPDLSMIYLVGKGDTVVRYYEITDEAPYVHYITTYQSSSPQRGMGVMPKRGCNVNTCEIMRFYKVVCPSTVGSVESITMVVPRKSDLYQGDIYPDTISEEPTLNAEEWACGNGKEVKPKLKSMECGFAGHKDSKANKPAGLKKAKGLAPKASAPAKIEAPEKTTPAPKIQSPTPFKPASSPFTSNSQSQNQSIAELVAEIEKLKATVAEQEKRIEALENK